MLFSLTGPSGVGKGFIKHALQATFPDMRELVWLTTRPLRAKELQGPANRRTVSQGHFERLRNSGKFAVHQTLYGNSYGITLDELTRSRSGGLWITEFHIDTLADIRSFVPDFVPIALIPESMSLLQERIIARDPATAGLAVRLGNAQREIAAILQRSAEFSLTVKVSKATEERTAEIVVAFLKTHIKESEP